MSLNKIKVLAYSIPLLVSLLTAGTAVAQADANLPGTWRINEKLSDDTDNKVEKALEESGAKLKKKWFDRRKDKYRGGPAEQELYDRLSYDAVLTITPQADGYLFEYADGFKSVIYTDNRSHSVSLNGLADEGDFSLGHWEDGKFVVEMHPRDGGYVNAIYSLVEVKNVSNRGKESKSGQANFRLHANYLIKPGSFTEEIELERVYDRKP